MSSSSFNVLWKRSIFPVVVGERTPVNLCTIPFSPNAPGDLASEIRAYLDAGIDGVFTDNPDIGVAAVAAS